MRDVDWYWLSIGPVPSRYWHSADPVLVLPRGRARSSQLSDSDNSLNRDLCRVIVRSVLGTIAPLAHPLAFLCISIFIFFFAYVRKSLRLLPTPFFRNLTSLCPSCNLFTHPTFANERPQPPPSATAPAFRCSLSITLWPTSSASFAGATAEWQSDPISYNCIHSARREAPPYNKRDIVLINFFFFFVLDRCDNNFTSCIRDTMVLQSINKTDFVFAAAKAVPISVKW